jgi:hypothetical protein
MPPTTPTDTRATGQAAPTSTAPTQPTRKGRKPGTPPKVYNLEGLDVDLLSQPQEVPDALSSLTAPVRARDERQGAMDKVVKAKYDEWVAAGRPSRWPLMPKARYHVPPQAVEGLQMLVRRAADFYGCSVKWGSPARDAEGRQIVVFAVKDRREGKPRNETQDGSESAEAQEDQADASAADRAEQAGGEGLAP